MKFFKRDKGNKIPILFSITIAVLAVSAYVLPAAAVCIGCTGSSTDPPCCSASSAGSSGSSDSRASSGGMGDVTSGSRAHIQIFSPGGQYYIGDGFSAWVSGDQNTIITFNLLDGFKVENIEAIERTGIGFTDVELTASGAGLINAPANDELTDTGDDGYSEADFINFISTPAYDELSNVLDRDTSGEPVRTFVLSDDNPEDTQESASEEDSSEEGLTDTDIDGNTVTTETTTDDSGNTVTTTKQTDDDGNVVTTETTTDDTRNMVITTKETDADGNTVTTKTSIDNEGNAVLTTEKTDADGNKVTTKNSIDNNGNRVISTEKADADGNMLETTVELSTTIFGQRVDITTKFDPDGNILERTYIDESGKTFTAEYNKEGEITGYSGTVIQSNRWADTGTAITAGGQ